MRKVKQLIFMLSLIAAAGLTWTVITLKNIPEAFDWEDDHEDH
jgi:hypothetical protein